MRDFSCCGLKLPTLHDLLEHYEANHHQQMEELQKRASHDGPPPDPKAAIASNAAAALKDPAQAQHHRTKKSKSQAVTPQRSSTPVQTQHTPKPNQQGFAPIPQPSRQDDETVGDMEMDDDFAAQSAITEQYQMQQPRMMQRNQFGQQTSRAPPLDLSAVNGSSAILQHQGLRNSTPNTPVSASRNGTFYQNNPTVSSVNTPTLSAHPTGSAHALQQQQQYYTPESSAPGTPGELDPEFVGNLGQMNVGYMGNANNGYSNWGFTPNNEMLDLCIDEPAKRLFASGGIYNPSSVPQPQEAAPTSSATQLGDGQYSENSELARTIREQQKLAGVPDPSADGVPKPFHCPVIGCEKAYKNQNGLKYHKSVTSPSPFPLILLLPHPFPPPKVLPLTTQLLQHGHNTQTLHSNSNGTFSIVDPETLQPFPGTLGMEKHKPYQCQSCGKRYKNLNGLKYHKAHSQGCDPEIRGIASAGGSKRNSLEMRGAEEGTEGGMMRL